MHATALYLLSFTFKKTCSNLIYTFQRETERDRERERERERDRERERERKRERERERERKPVRFYKNNRSARDSIRQHLQQMLDAIDKTPLTRQQKLRLFRFGVCPRISWPLLIEDLPISLLERELQPLATTALKKWAGLARSSSSFFQ